MLKQVLSTQQNAPIQVRETYHSYVQERAATDHNESGEWRLTLPSLQSPRGLSARLPKLSSQNRQLIDTIAETEKTTKPTSGAIADTYKSRTGVRIEEKDLLQELSETEKTGIIASEIASVQDEPTHVWRAKLTIKKGGGNKRLSVSKQTITFRLK